MAKLFLSYAREDSDWVEQLVHRLESAGHDVWWDRDIAVGAAFDRMIEEQINKCDIVVVVWSQHSVESNWVRAEAATALDHNKLVPVVIAECAIPLRFKMIQTADLRDVHPETEHHRIVRFVSEIEQRKSPDQAHSHTVSMSTSTAETQERRSPVGAIIVGVLMILVALAMIAGAFAILLQLSLI